MHLGGRLERDAARVEGHALAHEDQWFHLAAWGRIKHDEAGRGVAAAKNRGKRAHAHPHYLLGAEDLHAKAELRGQIAGDPGQIFGSGHVGRSVDQITGQNDPVRHGQGPIHFCLHVRLAAPDRQARGAIRLAGIGLESHEPVACQPRGHDAFQRQFLAQFQTVQMPGSNRQRRNLLTGGGAHGRAHRGAEPVQVKLVGLAQANEKAGAASSAPEPGAAGLARKTMLRIGTEEAGQFPVRFVPRPVLGPKHEQYRIFQLATSPETHVYS
jgi:hypothetical protein